MRRINIQTDTFCATGCTYCYLATREKNPAKYDFEKLKEFIAWYKPDAISIYGADTFYDKEQTKKVFDAIIDYKELMIVPIISEASKLKRDMDMVCYIHNECKRRGVIHTPEFSCDLFGVKSVFQKEALEELYAKTHCEMIYLKCVITVEQLLNEDIVKRLYEIKDALGTAKVKAISFRLVIDYNAIASTQDVSKQTEKIIKSIQHTDRLFFTVSNDIHGKQMLCASRNREEILVDVYGNISTCAKTHPEYELAHKATIFQDVTSWEKMEQSAKKFREYNDKVVLKKCLTCKARAHCNVCVKYVYKQYGISFNAETALCSFYKTVTKTRLEKK